MENDVVFKAMDRFAIELPSWGFANTGTRFGKFIQDAAATSTEEKLADAGQVHAFTGCCPTVAMHVKWDFPCDKSTAAKYGVAIGSINPNVFEDQIYKHGSLGNPDAEVRAAALQHLIESVEIAKRTQSRDLSLWFADGSNFPGTANIRQRRQWFEEGLKAMHARLAPDQRMLLEYKPFEPAFYHTDIADWGMSLLLARAAGPQAKVLVDTGHHYQTQNIEQIVAWLLAENMLGGFHFNDRRYADDDLTLGSIDPYQAFRIFHEINLFEWETGSRADIAYMVDQSHNLKPKIEEMIQTATFAQELYAKASLVDLKKLAHYQSHADLIDAEECLKSAFSTDVRPAIREWRRSKGLAENPLEAFRASGYLARAARERAERNRSSVSSYA
ncbi:MAG TPA: TIM barrel protein [Bryobacteraceae bacterium]|jgi:L-rhamnose isomerase/sugar isomerase|nr:TIM barrel protein [Bryobacteraceae bacterium]